MVEVSKSVETLANRKDDVAYIQEIQWRVSGCRLLEVDQRYQRRRKMQKLRLFGGLRVELEPILALTVIGGRSG